MASTTNENDSIAKFIHAVGYAAECCIGICSCREASVEASLAPLIKFAPGSNTVESIENFGPYVVRQLGVPEDHGIAPSLSKAAIDYLQGDKSKSDTSRDQLMSIVENALVELSDEDMQLITNELVDELDACMLTYFGFHWDHADLLINQVIKGRAKKKPNFKDAVRKATSSQRVQTLIKHLGPQRKLSVLIDELRLLESKEARRHLIPSSGEVLVPASESDRSPVLLLIGGGMGAGKSTVVKEVMKSPFWCKVAVNAVVVEADAFKEKDVIYQALMAEESADLSQISQLVHESSTNAASALLVTALNSGRDVIFDGTMSWAPFVTQTIEMARNIHRERYRMGPGYQKLPSGDTVESYWETTGEPVKENAKAYRIEIVGVVCDAHLAVMRGMRRAILTGRGVPVGAQLKSHLRFASSFDGYASLVDKTMIYKTDEIGKPAELVAYREGYGNMLYDPGSLQEIQQIRKLNPSAKNALQLFPRDSDSHGSWKNRLRFSPGGNFVPGAVWNKFVACEKRKKRQADLQEAFLSLQACAMPDRLRNGDGGYKFTPRFDSLDDLRGKS